MDKFASSSSARLFLAAVPDAGTAERIHRLAGVLKHAHRFDGKLIAPERLHISLFFLGGLPQRQMLGAALTRSGLRRVANTNFTPHVTLLYDGRSVDEHPIQPIFWTVTEFVLIRSMKGHDYLARWPLQA